MMLLRVTKRRILFPPSSLRTNVVILDVQIPNPPALFSTSEAVPAETMGIKGVLVWRIIPGLVVAIAAAVISHDFPLAFIFATVIPLSKGTLPPSLVGHGKMKGTPEVPTDLVPRPRPKDELFLDLPGGGRLPRQGIGMCCRATATDDVMVYRTVLWYLLLGGRHIDGAHFYLNHAAIGRGISEAIRRGVPREEIFVTTKIFPTHFGFESAKESVLRYLSELGVDYIDMVLLHWPQNFPLLSSPCQKEGRSRSDCRTETWRALSELRMEGLIKHAGVSNFSLKHIKELQNFGGAPIANNQISFHPFEPDHVMETVKYCQSNGITITAYSPLG
jgi:diketogulonate reductase-like aldo/keto reductase